MPRLSKAFANLLRYVKYFGPVAGPLTYLKLRLGARGELVSVKPPGSNVPIQLRRGTVDVGTWDEIFISGEYDMGALAEEPRTIIDAGAHIGMTSVYMALRYPSAKIVALEPDNANFEILQKNAQGFPGIQPVKAALWTHKGKVSFVEADYASVSGYCIEAPEGDAAVDAVSVESVMAERQWDVLHILKIDIEGSEREIFAESSAWIRQVRNFAIECHDHRLAGCEASVTKALEGIPLRHKRTASNHLYMS